MISSDGTVATKQKHLQRKKTKRNCIPGLKRDYRERKCKNYALRI